MNVSGSRVRGGHLGSGGWCRWVTVVAAVVTVVVIIAVSPLLVSERHFTAACLRDDCVQ